jgi:hypothetical protein
VSTRSLYRPAQQRQRQRESHEGRFNGYNAGSFSGGAVHPLALGLLKNRRLRTRGLRGKSRDEFAGLGAPVIVTLAAAASARLRRHAVPAYIATQMIGAILGVWLSSAKMLLAELPVQRSRTL